MNSVNLVGRIRTEIELKQTNSSISYLNFALAIKQLKKGEDGKPLGMLISCIAFRNTAETIAQYCHNGDMLGVIGSLSESKYDKDGISITKIGVIVDKISFLQPKSKEKQKEDKKCQ